jgi:hypothetical protein
MMVEENFPFFKGCVRLVEARGGAGDDRIGAALGQGAAQVGGIAAFVADQFARRSDSRDQRGGGGAVGSVAAGPQGRVPATSYGGSCRYSAVVLQTEGRGFESLTGHVSRDIRGAARMPGIVPAPFSPSPPAAA